MPFWSFPWAGGQALARYILDHPDIVAGRNVLDLAAGSGLVAIAAALAGAADVTANDIDSYAAAAQEMNAKANSVRPHHPDGRPARRPRPTPTSCSPATSVTSATSAIACSRSSPERNDAEPRYCSAILAAPICLASGWQQWPLTTSRPRLCSKTSKRSGPRSGRCAPASRPPPTITSGGDPTGSSGTALCRSRMHRAGRRRRGCRRVLSASLSESSHHPPSSRRTARFTSSNPSTCGRRATTRSPTSIRARREISRQSPGRNAGSIESPATTNAVNGSRISMITSRHGWSTRARGSVQPDQKIDAPGPLLRRMT